MKVLSAPGFRRFVPKIAAALCCVLAWVLAQPPSVAAEDRARLAARFGFDHHAISPADRDGDRRIRTVAPAYEQIRNWVSSVGAGAGLFAVDGGVVSHDICLVDPRTDTVTVEPAPTTGERYAAFTLAPTTLPYADYVAPMGCLPADLNEDGWQDVVVYYWGRSPVLFLRTPGSAPAAAGFSERELVSPPQVWNTNAATIADLDGDGHLDLFFGNYFPDGARVLDPTAQQPELVMTDSLSDGYNGGTHRYFRFAGTTGGNAPDVRYAEAVNPVEGDSRNTGWTLAAAAQDIDQDGLPELYVANDFSPDQLLVNVSVPGQIRFRESHGERHALTPKSKVVGKDSFKGMGASFADLNHDGMPDILVSNITEPYALQESNFAFISTGDRDALRRGVAPFDDRSEELGLSRSGWSWDVKAADFDNDGAAEVMHATGFIRGTTNRWPQMQEAAMSNDLILGNPALWPRFTEEDGLSGHDPNTFFTRSGGGRFIDVADLVGVGTDAVSRAFAVGDVDGDGRLDFVVANQWAQSTLYRNTSQSAGEFVGLRLRQPAGVGTCAESNEGVSRPAIGATAVLTAPDGTKHSQQVYPANGHNGVNAPDLVFGLGDVRDGPLPVEVSWRDGCGQRHAATVNVTPGWHRILLHADGTTTVEDK
ncbi:VCBS repeat protein [Lentzea atacamensis]|uniref:VCBS repeat protein n=1 Tax=Lentzea atacamensis TaxID=531938 RepID=A0A316I8R5_9PSEU|nr:CRTAC1 family protein [Lentzea atacamensis]PWK89601.1 VCBS repeat protein [Lentzea atacamensis]RAS60619.1 VCBS repeat protein [Lentzea atacamensis]